MNATVGDSAPAKVYQMRVDFLKAENDQQVQRAGDGATESRRTAQRRLGHRNRPFV